MDGTTVFRPIPPQDNDWPFGSPETLAEKWAGIDSGTGMKERAIEAFERVEQKRIIPMRVVNRAEGAIEPRAHLRQPDLPAGRLV